MRRHITRRDKKRKKKLIVFSMISIICLFSAGYSAFSSNFLVSGKGTIVDDNFKLDSKVPTNDLLFWGQTDNKNNTETILKDKSGRNNDGILNGFDGTDVSGYNNGELVFDGIDDYVDIGYANYDFKNSQSYVLYVKVNVMKYQEVFGNWESGGGGIGFNATSSIPFYALHDGTGYKSVMSNTKRDILKYYTIIGTYDGSTAKLYVDGILDSQAAVSSLKNANMNIVIGANPESAGKVINPASISIKETMLYDRALTEDEVKILTERLQSKYTK